MPHGGVLRLGVLTRQSAQSTPSRGKSQAQRGARFPLLSACMGYGSGGRYTVFIPTYPFGVVSEMMLLYHALPVAKATGMYSLVLPNALNFGFSWHKFMIVRPFTLLPRLTTSPLLLHKQQPRPLALLAPF